MDSDLPEEAVFQHLFMESLVANTDPTCAICTEISRAYPLGNEQVNGQIYLYFSGSLRWGIELLIKGDKTSKHLNRYLSDGKNHPFLLDDWVVIDFCFKKPSRMEKKIKIMK